MREKYDDLAVVCYINSTAEIKAYCDVCITSSNAVKIVSKLKEKKYFYSSRWKFSFIYCKAS